MIDGLRVTHQQDSLFCAPVLSIIAFIVGSVLIMFAVGCCNGDQEHDQDMHQRRRRLARLVLSLLPIITLMTTIMVLRRRVRPLMEVLALATP